MFAANRIPGWFDYVGFQFHGILGMDFMGKYRITIETDTATLILREIKKKK